jgi:hypothetical protein
LRTADAPLQQAKQAHRLAERLGHPFGLAYALDQLAVLHLLRGEWRAVQECAQSVSVLATAQGFRFFEAHAMLLTGRALAAQGETASGLAQMRQGLAGIEATGQIQGMVVTLSLLAEAYALDGQVEARQCARIAAVGAIGACPSARSSLPEPGEARGSRQLPRPGLALAGQRQSLLARSGPLLPTRSLKM